jgi:hypothetical protein
MPFIISFTLSLLLIAAGLFLLIRSKQETGKFFRIMSWIIISCGFLAVLISIQLAIFKFAMHRHEESRENKNIFFKTFKSEKFEDMKDMFDKGCCDKDEGMFSFKDEDEDNSSCFKPEEQTTAIMKIISDNVKLTADQEKKIKTAIEESFEKICKKDEDKDKDEVKDVKK